ncbi:hypothetical protein [Haladaptatus salinisoli]|uniref:hypothetical protein n=1 Tax=Haladaptatus salinisoli TaxID=2884876 RepID=UPI001D0B0097|nr:hypothetical protein [Haladaptatus salinisoli]
MFGKVAKALDEPALIKYAIGRKINRAYHTRFGKREHNPDGIDVFEEDWDNLVILDSCRYDHFVGYDLPGTLDWRYSKGSSTREFLTANFRETKLHDTVYVSANAWFPRLADDIGAEIHDFVNLQQSEYQDEQLGVELPETVTDAAIRTEKEYPNKRLLIHYIQPHYPYIGPVGRQHISPKTNMLTAILEADVPPAVVRKAYWENLDEVMDEMKTLFDSLRGKTVVTADHGELIAERSFPLPYREYGHPLGTYTRKLVKVPWHVHDSGERKTVVPEEPRYDRSEVDEDVIDERLKNLGYRV